MNRRSFVISAAATLLLPHGMAAQATPSATPAGADRRPEPFDLGSGVTLIDYRVHPGDPAGIIGEIRNDSGRMIDAPVISLTPGPGGANSGFTWLSPLIPVIDAAGTVPVYGPAPEPDDPDAGLQDASFAICSPAEPGPFTAEAEAMDLDIVLIDEVVDPDVYRLRGTVTNMGNATVRSVELRAILRDAGGRIAGMANSRYLSTLAPGRAYPFSIYAYADPAFSNAVNPFALVDGASYGAELVAGPRGPVTRQGCEFGRPWD